MNKPSMRIDWFDGSVIEDTRPNVSSADFDDEDQPETPPPPKPQNIERKPIGFKRLLDISLLKPPILTLEVSNRPGFWNLFDQEDLKGDFIVLIVRILANVYKDIEPEENSKIATLLKTRFLKSDFLERLRKYLLSLPEVRIYQKKMNMQLWDDVEGFYFQILELCRGIIRFGGNSKELIRLLHELVEVLESSAIGVREEHTERFSDQLFDDINILKSETEDTEDDWESFTTPQEATDPQSFKNLTIFPSQSDLLTNSSVNIQPNIINGAYTNVEHYLDIQFKLLREDCFGPLREGISKYMENPSKRRHENIRVYPQVRVLRTYVSNNKVGHLIDLACNERRTGTDIQKCYNKQLMFGSLLLFTNDNFKTVLCATVLDSSFDLMRDGYLAVSFQNPISKTIFAEPYLMIESEVFFEPYHQVLKVLQNSGLDDLPMKKYIVDVKPETKPPAYLTEDTLFTLQSKDGEIPFPVLDITQWPESHFGLDQSQLEAYKFALTREFAVIQGPPGTGKTFIGVKIASTLLKNLSLEGTPMLIICYTNHALDQFLEGILNVTDSIVRLGSQSKSKKLEPYNLYSLRSKIKCKYSYLYANKRSELEYIYKEMMDLQTEIEKCDDNILSYNSLKNYLNINGRAYELNNSHGEPILNWLFEHLEPNKSTKNNDKININNLEIKDKITTCFSEKWALNEIESVNNLIKYVTEVNQDATNSQESVQKFNNQISKIQRRLDCFKKYMTTFKNNKELYKINEVQDLYELTTEKRWQLYFNVVREIKNELLNKMDTLLQKHNTANEELEEVSNQIDSEVMRTVRVVGVTTTAAARRHQLIKKLNSPIVIVEEAAEVLEAHIVASLTHHCKHLILIGDHKQLRPSAAHYKLAKHYNLEISLFERMIRNKVHSRTLTIQRRMRPQNVELLVPTIYEQLNSHPTVYEYENVRGMKENLYFYDHQEFEDSEGLEDSWSHKNTYEAKWCLALANYLRQKKYEADDVTVLATYVAQVGVLKKMSQKYELLRNIKITAVDNYQGEESRIVILSLVRSNRDGKIGFLSAANRICVALSRAKEGFYIFGNMTLLKSASTIWTSINDKLVSQRAIGNKLQIICDVHRTVCDVKTPQDFDTSLSGNCLRICQIQKTM